LTANDGSIVPYNQSVWVADSDRGLLQFSSPVSQLGYIPPFTLFYYQYTQQGNISIAGDLMVGRDLFVGRDESVGRDLAVARDLAVTGSGTVTGNLSVTRDQTVGRDLTTGRDLVVTGSGTVTGNLYISRDQIVGRDVAIGSDLSVIRNQTIGRDLAVTGSGVISGNLSVGRDQTVGRDLSGARDLTVGRDQIVGRDLAVTGSGVISGNLSVNRNTALLGDVVMLGAFTVDSYGLHRITRSGNTAYLQTLTSGGPLPQYYTLVETNPGTTYTLPDNMVSNYIGSQMTIKSLGSNHNVDISSTKLYVGAEYIATTASVPLGLGGYITIYSDGVHWIAPQYQQGNSVP
jgi:hypothetical protein